MADEDSEDDEVLSGSEGDDENDGLAANRLNRRDRKRRKRKRDEITDMLLAKIRELTEEATNESSGGGGGGGPGNFQPTPNYENVDVNRIPTEAKQKDLFIFAKFVAGHCGIGDMNVMFDKSEVSKFVDEVNVMMIHQVFLAAISSTEEELEIQCEMANQSISFEEDILPNMEHKLYRVFAKFTAFFMRKALAKKPGMIVPLRQQADLMLEQLSYRTELGIALKNRKRKRI
jgi:hypothetical protein